MIAHLTHVTLTSGHRRISPRSEVGGDVVERLRPVLREALTGPGREAPLPGPPGYWLTGAAEGACATLTLWPTDPTSEGPERSRVPVLTIGVAARSRCGAHLWRLMHEGRYLATSPEEHPPAPWVADIIEPGMALRPEAAAWTGDLSRCLAWTWIEL